MKGGHGESIGEQIFSGSRVRARGSRIYVRHGEAGVGLGAAGEARGRGIGRSVGGKCFYSKKLLKHASEPACGA